MFTAACAVHYVANLCRVRADTCCTVVCVIHPSIVECDKFRLFLQSLGGVSR